MAAVEILEVVHAPLNAQRFLGARIDFPRPGERRDHYALLVAGWVLRSEDGFNPVEVVAEGRTVARWQADRRRPDVAAAFPNRPVTEACGFMGVLHTLTLAPEFELSIEAVDSQSRSCIGTIRGRRSRLAEGSTPATGMEPLLVTTLGRTGSTLLMLLLGRHPRVVVHPPFPYEARVASYWAAAFEGLSNPASYLQSLTGANDRRYWWVGYSAFPAETYVDQDPAARWLGGIALEELGRQARRQVSSFYDVSAGFQGKISPAYFAEKRLPLPGLQRLQAELFPALKEIYLVRDPRDMMTSILAFNPKRQGAIATFGRDWSEGDEDYIEEQGKAFAQLLDGWHRTPQPALLVRFEDLIRDPRSTLGDILAFLGLEREPRIVDEMIRSASTVEAEAQQQHRTTPDGPSSIGRWKRELPQPLQECCQRVFRAALVELGYEPAAAERKEPGR
jgi:hypothetical protein